MDDRADPFHDGYWYCYANATAMLLAASGAPVSPRLIEVLSGVGLGAFQTAEGLPFFSGLCGLPDTGISAALAQLGFAWTETATDDAATDPFDALAAQLKVSPAVLGPLDMRHLVYNPMRPRGPGVDHFVLALAMDGDTVRLHDPAGFAHALIARPDLEAAWRAESIGYRRGHFRCWSRPHRVRAVPDDDLQASAIRHFAALYRDAAALAAQRRERIDGALIRDWAEAARHGALGDARIGHLTHFALPLGAKRALDYAGFFARRWPVLAELKRAQAVAFGACHSHLLSGDRRAAADQFSRLADIEDGIAGGLQAG